MKLTKGELRRDRILLIVYYLVIVGILIVMYGRGDFSTTPFVYQGF